MTTIANPHVTVAPAIGPEPTVLPIFPNKADVVYEQARAFRRKTAAERFRALFDLIDFGLTFVAGSPRREVGRRLRQQQKVAWRKIQKELFARHA